MPLVDGELRRLAHGYMARERRGAAMPAASEIDRRNRALVAFTLMTGARDSAIASMKLKHVDLAAGSVYQDARDVKTKFSKSFTTFFLPVGEDVRKIVEEWVRYLRQEKLWGNHDPLFPATATTVGNGGEFQVAGLKRGHWRSAAPIRGIFKEAFTAAGLPYFNPHSLRNTLVQLGETLCRTPEDFKAWSQNLGHEGVLTTFRSYGAVSNRRQGQIIRGLGQPAPGQQVSEQAVLAVLKKLVDTERLEVVGLIQFRGHSPKGGYDVHTDGRDSKAKPARAPAIR